MTTKVGGAFIEMRASNKNLKSDLDKSKKTVTSATSEMEKQATKSFSKIKLAAVAAFAVIAYKSVQLIKQSAMAAARFETLGVVMRQVGENAGYAANTMDNFDKELRKTGISMIESRNSLAKMAQAQLDLSKATQLGRIAQDAAVIGNINSSDAFGRMIRGIQSGQTEILKTIGINVNFGTSYKLAAKEMGKAVGALTELEKTIIRQNAVLKFGTRIAGTYEAAMSTAGKKMSSFTRYVEDFKVKMGTAFGPAMVIIIDKATDAMKEFASEVVKPEVQTALKEMAINVANIAKGAIDIAVWMSEATSVAITKLNDLDKAYFKTMNKQDTILKRMYSRTTIQKLNDQLSLHQGKLKELTGLQSSWVGTYFHNYGKQIKAEEERIRLLKERKRMLESLITIGKKDIKPTAQTGSRIKQKGFDIASLTAPVTTEIFDFTSTDAYKQLQSKFTNTLTDETQKREDINRSTMENRVNEQRQHFIDMAALRKQDLEDEKKAGEEKAKIDKGVSDLARQRVTATAQAYSDIAGNTAQIFKMMSDQGGKHAKANFEAYKVFAIAQAAISTALGVANTLGNPLLIWPSNVILATSIGVLGAAQIGLISQQQYTPPSFDVGGISNARGVYQTGDIREAHVPIPSGRIPVKISGGGKQKTVQIILNNPVFQDLNTQRLAMAQIATEVTKQVAPGAVVEDYNNDGMTRSMVKGGF